MLKDVYQSREKDVLLKQEQRKEADWFKNYEKSQIETSIAQQNAEFEARAAKESAVRKNHQMDILKQMNEKQVKTNVYYGTPRNGILCMENLTGITTFHACGAHM